MTNAFAWVTSILLSGTTMIIIVFVLTNVHVFVTPDTIGALCNEHPSVQDRVTSAKSLCTCQNDMH